MCGIVYIRRTDGGKIIKTLWKKYNAQKTRGKDGFGFVAVDNRGMMSEYCRAADEKSIKKSLDAHHGAREILFHHRTPTSTVNVKETAHPIKVSLASSKYDYYVIHNGIISNDDELKKAHNAQGIAYTTEISTQYTVGSVVYRGATKFNDSEALAVDLVLTFENAQSTSRAKGSVAFVAYQIHRITGKVIALYYGHNAGAPLILTRGNNIMALTSEGISDYHNALADDVIYRYDYATDKTAKMTATLSSYAVITPYGYGYSGYGYGYSRYGYGETSKKSAWNDNDDYDDDDDALLVADPLHLLALNPTTMTEAEYLTLLESVDELDEDLRTYEVRGEVARADEIKSMLAELTSIQISYERYCNIHELQDHANARRGTHPFGFTR